MSTQAPLQSVCPSGHLVVQAELLQTCVSGQTFVHEPQCCGSEVVSTHLPLQKVAPLAQRHLDETHLPEPQPTLQAPQFA